MLEASGGDRDALTLEHAQRAADDLEALAFVGGFHSSQVLAAAPVLAASQLAQIAPVATYSGLRGETLVTADARRRRPGSRDRALARTQRRGAAADRPTTTTTATAFR